MDGLRHSMTNLLDGHERLSNELSASVAASIGDAPLRSQLAAGLDAPAPAHSARVAESLAHIFGTSTVAVVHYGSHAHCADARPESAPDFFVIVSDYLAAYRSLAATVGTHYRPSVAASLNRVLAPNVVAVGTPAVVCDRATHQSSQRAVRAKCAIFSWRDFRRACIAPRDHFVQGRLAQLAQLTWARDDASRAAVADAIVDLRARSFERNRVRLPQRFDARAYCRALIHTSFAVEIRPERPERIDALLADQQATMVPMYAELLRSLANRGTLCWDGAAYTDARPPGPWPRLRSAMYFRRTKLRATARWAKYVMLYDDWLDYAVQKVARRGGTIIELTDRERRWPLIFLWPKLLRFVRSRAQRHA
jgi:hypothetical protein